MQTLFIKCEVFLNFILDIYYIRNLRNQKCLTIERRRAALERFVNRTAAHPILRTDPDFREFLEQEADLPKSNQTSTL